jgi:hypothetical protein
LPQLLDVRVFPVLSRNRPLGLFLLPQTHLFVTSGTIISRCGIIAFPLSASVTRLISRMLKPAACRRLIEMAEQVMDRG